MPCNHARPRSRPLLSSPSIDNDSAGLDKQPRDGELAALERKCFTRPWAAADYARLRANPLVSAWILRGRDDAPRGYVCFQLVAGEVEIFRIGVLPKLRGQGWGRVMLDELLAYAGKSGAERVYLEVRAGNTAARRLYDSAGFRRLAEREGYFQNPREDALVFGYTPHVLAPRG